MSLKVFAILIVSFVLMCVSAWAGTGSIDKREYVDWSSAPYNRIVYFRPDKYSTCTAQYVARDIILTARHCIASSYQFDNYENLGKQYTFYLHDGRTSSARLEHYGQNSTNDDWALLRITDSNFYMNDYFDVAQTTTYLSVVNAGFGYMRILSDYEISQLKNIFEQISQQENRYMYFDDILDAAKEKIQQAGIPNLDDYDSNYMYRLKADKTCALTHTMHADDTISTTCDAWGGNSGGAYFSGDTLYGICSKGADSWDDDKNTDYAVSPKLYHSTLMAMRKTSPEITNTPNIPNEPVVPTETPAETDKPAPEETDTTPQGQQTPDDTNVPSTPVTTEAQPNTLVAAETDISPQELETLGNNLNQSAGQLLSQAENVSEMPDNEFLNFLDNVTEYDVLKRAYEHAREREQSLGNRLLGGLAIGMAGIGGMQAFSAVAEQNADKQAEQDMKAYLATFRCDFGQGRNIQGGEKGIELPGANSLTQMVMEYTKLAEDLKVRKAALGLPPGIESEHVISAADTGLYDNVSLGKTDGAYTSLSRALMDKDSEDAAEWAAQQDKTDKKLKTGAIIGGTGIVGGAIGNAIINRDKEKDKEE